MTLSLQEISDRMEIQDLIVDYSHAIDSRNWDGLDAVFTPDAIIDYTAVGGARGTLPEIKKWLAEAMEAFSTFQHMSATSKITIHGDTAEGRTILHNPMVWKESGEMFYCGVWYVDRYVRTPEGWRIAERVEEKCYMR